MPFKNEVYSLFRMSGVERRRRAVAGGVGHQCHVECPSGFDLAPRWPDHRPRTFVRADCGSRPASRAFLSQSSNRAIKRFFHCKTSSATHGARRSSPADGRRSRAFFEPAAAADLLFVARARERWNYTNQLSNIAGTCETELCSRVGRRELCISNDFTKIRYPDHCPRIESK